MKIALLGYGKMGKIIEKIALSRGHEIVIKAQSNTSYNITNADVAIEFSVPAAAVNNLTNCINNQIPVVCGTTGWLEQYNKISELCKEKNSAFLYASNFSLGVNVFFKLNQYLAKIMASLSDYRLDIEEIHHTQKLDKPSGTAISLAQDIIKENPQYNNWILDQEQNNKVPIYSKRIENIPGTHSITYQSSVDSIKITHTAKNREGFALGAVLAAEWIANKKGVFTMNDVLNIN